MSIRQNGNVVVCTAKSQNTNEKLVGKVKLLLTANKPLHDANYTDCNKDDYCLNRGQCYKDSDDHIYCV